MHTGLEGHLQAQLEAAKSRESFQFQVEPRGKKEKVKPRHLKHFFGRERGGEVEVQEEDPAPSENRKQRGDDKDRLAKVDLEGLPRFKKVHGWQKSDPIIK